MFLPFKIDYFNFRQKVKILPLKWVIGIEKDKDFDSKGQKELHNKDT